MWESAGFTTFARNISYTLFMSVLEAQKVWWECDTLNCSIIFASIDVPWALGSIIPLGKNNHGPLRTKALFFYLLTLSFVNKGVKLLPENYYWFDPATKTQKNWLCIEFLQKSNIPDHPTQ